MNSEEMARLHQAELSRFAPMLGGYHGMNAELPWDELPNATRQLLIATAESVLHALMLEIMAMTDPPGSARWSPEP